jgi:hypothetical protein
VLVVEAALGVGIALLVAYPLRGLRPPAWGRGYRYWWLFAFPLLALADHVFAVTVLASSSALEFVAVLDNGGPFYGYSLEDFTDYRLITFVLGVILGLLLLVACWAISLLAAGVAVFARLWGGATRRAVHLWVPASITPYLAVTSVLYLGSWGLVIPRLPDIPAESKEQWEKKVEGLPPREREKAKRQMEQAEIHDFLLKATGVTPVALVLIWAGALAYLLPAFYSLRLTAESVARTDLSPRTRRANREYRLMDTALRALPTAIGLAFLGETLGLPLGWVWEVVVLVFNLS